MSKPLVFHFGDNCAPTIVIDELMGNRRVNPFKLGIYPLNTILQILKDDNLESLYDKNCLLNEARDNITVFESTQNKFCHVCLAKHSIYKDLIFVHDYEVIDKTILNYEFVKNSFIKKISNFKSDLKENNFKVFINHTHLVDDQRFEEVIDLLQSLIGNDRFVLICLAEEIKTQPPVHNNLRVFKLVNSIKKWYEMTSIQKVPLYKEIHENVKEVVRSYGQDWPEFKDTCFASRDKIKKRI